MTTQPEALRLATALEKFWAGEPGYDRERQAAAELRRLSAVETDLLAMRRVFSEAGCTFDVNYIRRLVRAEAQRDLLLEALKGLMSEEPNIYEGRLEASLYVTVDALEAARAAIKAVEEGK